MVDTDILKWRFDINTFRLLGRDLITDRITALFELVKNAYDANAQNVYVEFIDVDKISDKRKIIIRDDGIGMTLDDVKNKWMVVGTSSKRYKKITDAPYNRRVVGEKGVGRFAVDKLGSRLTMKTKKQNEKQELNVEINWNIYDELSKERDNTLFFTDVENKYWLEAADNDKQYTHLIIEDVREKWTKLDIERAYKELANIVNPFYLLVPPFNVFITSNEHTEFSERIVFNDGIEYASHAFKLNYDLEQNTQEKLKFENGEMSVIKTPLQNFGPLSMQLYYFNEEAKGRFNKKFKNADGRIDGIKVYRDGLIATPFAEDQAHPDHKRDVLGIDKRVWRAMFDRVSSREIIGIINISSQYNDKITDATNRQDFVANDEYDSFKKFVIDQLIEIEKLKLYLREQTRQFNTRKLEKIPAEVRVIADRIKEITKDVKEANFLFSPAIEEQEKLLERQIQKVEQTIKENIRQTKEIEKENIRKENIYLSLMSLQDYAIHITHIIRTSFEKILHLAEFFKDQYPNPKFDDYFKKYSLKIYDEIMKLSKAMDFMLSYAASDKDLEVKEFDIKKLIENLFFENYERIFEVEEIKNIVEIKDDFTIVSNYKFFEDIIENLISNSIKAVQANEGEKMIKCSGYIDKNQFLIYFSDNGYGIKRDNWERIFEMFFTTTADIGGAGLGLYITKTRIEALKGTIEVIESEFSPMGTTMKITFPLNQKK